MFISKKKNIENESRFVDKFSIVMFLLLHLYLIVSVLGYAHLYLFLPYILFIIDTLIQSSKLNIKYTAITYIVSVIILTTIVNSEIINKVHFNFKNGFILILITIFLLIKIFKFDNIVVCTDKDNKSEKKLFNIMYVNTSKVHEITMLFDNEIMKTIKKEQSSEKCLKSSYTFGVGKGATLDNTINKSENYKKRVFESFDIKMTKSIMLRKIYSEVIANPPDVNQSEFINGQLIILKDIKLSRRNLDDSVFLLNVLQDSNIKNQGDENIEINMNKMMEKMLDDFTIDYTFEYKINDIKSKYIIQLPYNSNGNFENGYQHNDLQLGELSIIGICRGEVDFSNRDTVSSKFLEVMSNVYNDSVGDINYGSSVKLSSTIETLQSSQLEFKYNKLNEKIKLIDVIAIIQELNLGNKEG